MGSGIKEDARRYIKQMGEITLPAFKDKMRVNEKEAKELLWGLVADGLVENSVGFLFRYVGRDDQNPQDDVEQGNSATQDTLFDELFVPPIRRKTKQELATEYWDRKREQMAQRRKELREHYKAMLDDNEDDDDDEDDDDEWLFDDDEDDDDEEDGDKEAIKTICCDVLNNAPKEEGEDDKMATSNAPQKTVLEEQEKSRELARIVTAFGCSGDFSRGGASYFCTLGIMYPDDMPMTFRLSYTDKITLTDCGLTHRFMSRRFDLSDEKLQARIEQIMQEYGLQWVIEGEEKKLSIQIRNQDGAFVSFLCFFSAIERLSHLAA